MVPKTLITPFSRGQCLTIHLQWLISQAIVKESLRYAILGDFPDTIAYLIHRENLSRSNIVKIFTQSCISGSQFTIESLLEREEIFPFIRNHGLMLLIQHCPKDSLALFYRRSVRSLLIKGISQFSSENAIVEATDDQILRDLFRLSAVHIPEFIAECIKKNDQDTLLKIKKYASTKV